VGLSRKGPGDPDRPDADVELPAALRRLERVRSGASRPTRDISGSSGSFLPGSGGVPGYVAEAFATAAHGKPPLAERLISREHPGALKVSTPRIINGAATNVQAGENASIQETDPTSTLAEVPTATIAGQLDLSRQLYDFSNPGSDEWIAAELGADYASKLEIQLISGSGSAGQLLGLRNVGTGSTTVTKANGSPTFQTNLAAIGSDGRALGSARREGCTRRAIRSRRS
jgi:HK97 family phage major capsid protein